MDKECVIHLNKIKMKGTYGAVRYSQKSVDQLMAFARSHNIPNLIDATLIHSTIVYSVDPVPSLEHCTTTIASSYLEAYPLEFDVVGSRPIPGVHPTRILVLKLHSPHLVEFHRLIHEIHNAKYDFEDYTPHIALSYDIGDFQISTIESEIEKLEVMDVENFYATHLDPHWALKN